MRSNFLTFALLFVSTAIALAQNPYKITGSAVDTAASAKLLNTSISVLNAKDSTLYKFTRAKGDGSFAISDLSAGKFILLVTYPGYADYVEHFQLDAAKPARDFGNINLLLKANLLKEVMIKGDAVAIKIKGDTTEFNAAAFKIEPNSKVEDLLKQFPGIQVDQNGKITAQGETVEKVLVDGEEFFGDDPTLVTKNLRGDMVDKVQLFDKKSDQATFTGIDDGVKTKTLNIQLKEDKKTGYFGKVDAGGASDDFYQGQGMYNKFKGKQKFSAYATVGNTGKTGLSWRDNDKYAGSSNVEFSDDGGIMIMWSGNDEFESFSGRYNNQGIPLAHTGGVHYDSKWNKDKESINANYKVGRIAVDGIKNTLSQNNLPSGILSSNSDHIFNNSAFRQKLDVTYQLKLDSASNLKIVVDGTLKDNQAKNSYNTNSVRGNHVLLNTSNRALTNEGEQRMFNASALWNKKFRKKGRTVSLNVRQSVNQEETDGFLNSVNSFFDEQGALTNVQSVNQRKVNTTESSVFSSNLAYTEPLSKALSVVVNYGLGLNNSSADRESYNQSPSGQYDQLDPVFSNDFTLDQLSNQFGAAFNYKKDKMVVNFGSKATAVKFDQRDNINGIRYERNFINLNPQGRLQYNLAKQKSLYFNYYGNTNQPTINQIQPVLVNDDPLNITLGNPDLKPSFRSSFSIGYNSYKILTDQYIYFHAFYGFTSNAIVNNVTTDAEGRNTYQSFNMKDRDPANFSFYGNISRKVNKAGLNIGINLSANGNTYYNLINDEVNMTQSYNFSGGVRISQYKAKKYRVSLNAGPAYNRSQASLQKQINNNGWGLNTNAHLSVTLPGKLEIVTDGNYEFQQKTLSFDQDFDRMIWNTSINKRFLKQENLTLSLSGNDLLNQNIGFSRSANGNFITQNSYNTIKRYFMFSLVWDFNKMGGGAPNTN
ncbi:MAG TPA: outer membrane beta-barrel family protein [Sphingobacteriaceae bacterium]